MKFLKIASPFIVLAICAAIANVAISNKPQAKRRPRHTPTLTVEAVRLQKQDYPIVIRSQGIVRPRTESTLIPEISGRVVSVAPAFREGGFFEQGGVLLTIDPQNYEIEVTIAESALAEAKLTLQEEAARAKQALRDWDRLGEGGTPDDLVLRKPQLARARAAVGSADAQLRKTRLDLKRTQITSPYAGRVLEQSVDIGQYVSPGTLLARIYAVDYAEVRLPLTNRQLQFIDIPERYRGESVDESISGPAVSLMASVGKKRFTWHGTVVRTEGAIDEQSRQLFVVAQVDDPYARTSPGNPPLKVGQFVRAEIKGQKLKDIFVIPRGAVREGDHVLIIDSENALHRREIDVVWSDAENAIVAEGLNEEELLCVTVITMATDGAIVKVRVLGEKQDTPPHPQVSSQDAVQTQGAETQK